MSYESPIKLRSVVTAPDAPSRREIPRDPADDDVKNDPLLISVPANSGLDLLAVAAQHKGRSRSPSEDSDASGFCDNHISNEKRYKRDDSVLVGSGLELYDAVVRFDERRFSGTPESRFEEIRTEKERNADSWVDLHPVLLWSLHKLHGFVRDKQNVNEVDWIEANAPILATYYADKYPSPNELAFGGFTAQCSAVWEATGFDLLTFATDSRDEYSRNFDWMAVSQIKTHRNSLCAVDEFVRQEARDSYRAYTARPKKFHSQFKWTLHALEGIALNDTLPSQIRSCASWIIIRQFIGPDRAHEFLAGPPAPLREFESAYRENREERIAKILQASAVETSEDD